MPSCLNDGRLIQRRDFLALRPNPAINFDAPVARHNRFSFRRPQVVDMSPLLRANFQNVAESAVGDQTNAGQPVLDERIRGHRRAMGEEVDLL